MPIILETSCSFLVAVMSDLLGELVQEGWLWTRITLWALSSIASANTSLGWTRLWFRSHIVMIFLFISLFAQSRVIEITYSCLLVLYSRTWSSTSWIHSISIESPKKCLFANSKALTICRAFTLHIHLIFSKSSRVILQALFSITLFAFLDSLNTSSHFIPEPSIVATNSQLSSLSGP